MDDGNGNIIYYIILGAIYLISRLFGKKKQPQKPATRPSRPSSQRHDKQPVRPPVTTPPETELSFEDILRELAGGKSPKPVADPEPAPEPPSFDPAPPLEQDTGIKPAPPIEGRTQPSYSIDSIDEIAGEFKIPDPIGSERLSEPDLAALRRKDLLFKRDDKYSLKKRREIDYLSLLKKQDGPAKAFVLSQIFDRKY